MGEGRMSNILQAQKLVADLRDNLAQYDDPDYLQPALESVLELWLQLKDLTEVTTQALAEAEHAALDMLDGGTATAHGHEWRQDTRRTTQWDADKAKRLVDAAKLTIARKVSQNPITGELEEDRARIAMEALAELDRWQTISARSLKTSTLKAEGFSLDDYAEVSRHFVLKAVPI